MTIAFLVVKHPLRGGGVEKYTYELARRLVQRGHEVTVYAMRHHGPALEVFEGVTVKYVPTLALRSTEKLSCALSAAVSILRTRARFDIIHFHSVAAGAVAPLIRRNCRASVLQMHGIEWKRQRWGTLGRLTLRVLELLALRGHHGYTAVSEVQRRHYAEMSKRAMTVIPTGASVGPTPSSEHDPEQPFQPGTYVLFASRLVPEKGAHYLIKAFRTVDTELTLVVAGDAPGEDAYRARLQKLSAGDSRIRFVGNLDGAGLAAAFAGAVVYVHPSDLEGLSISLVEAMAYRRCCLVSDIPENREAVGEAARLFRAGDPASLATELTALLKDGALRESLGALAQERASARYSWDRIADQFEDLYEVSLEQANSDRSTDDH